MTDTDQDERDRAVTLLAVDPGKRRSGWALYQDNRLSAAGFDAPSPALSPCPDLLVIERPQVYRAGKSQADPNDLIDVAIAVGRWIGAYSEAEVTLYLPRDWKGSVPKDVCHARARAALSADEIARVPRLPKTAGLLDMWDAIALGLVHLGRSRMR